MRGMECVLIDRELYVIWSSSLVGPSPIIWAGEDLRATALKENIYIVVASIIVVLELFMDFQGKKLCILARIYMYCNPTFYVLCTIKLSTDHYCNTV